MLDAVNANTGLSSSLFTGKSKDKQDMFLKILSMELSNQNPLEPMKNSAWVAQLAQFSELSQGEEMNSQLKSLSEMMTFVQSSDLIGKEVSYLDDVRGELQGTVDAVSQKDGQVMLRIGEESVSFSKIITVSGEKI